MPANGADKAAGVEVQMTVTAKVKCITLLRQKSAIGLLAWK